MANRAFRFSEKLARIFFFHVRSVEDYVATQFAFLVTRPALSRSDSVGLIRDMKNVVTDCLIERPPILGFPMCVPGCVCVCESVLVCFPLSRYRSLTRSYCLPGCLPPLSSVVVESECV